MSNVKVDFAKDLGKVKIMHSVNNGPAGSKLRGGFSNFKYFEEAQIPYARNHDASFYNGYGGEYTVDVHRIFRDFDADENLPESYDFEMTDEYLKDIESVGTKTFYRLGSRIEHEKKVGTYPPKDFHKWARICEHIIRHYTEGWANGFKMDIEYWEIWNEPDCRNHDDTNPCWQGTREQFVELFTITVKHLKTCFPNLKIGGPAFMHSHQDEFNDLIFTALKKENLTIDFFSFHGYVNEPYKYYESGEHAYELLKKYGCEGKTELILNEWNYIRGWRNDEWAYTIRAEKGLKGSSFIAGTMCTGQKSKLDHMMYYDARPCGMNGMFDTTYLTPLKGYYPFKMYSKLYNMKNSVLSESDDDGIYTVAAADELGGGLMVTYFVDDDTAPSKEIKIDFENFKNADGANVEFYLLDENHDMELVRNEKIANENFSAYLNMNLYTTYFIKITRA